MQQQTAVGTDGRTPERELHGAVELEPQRAGLRFTRRVQSQMPAPLSLTCCVYYTITAQIAEE